MTQHFQHSVPKYIKQITEGYLYYEKHNGVNLTDIPVVNDYVQAVIKQLHDELGDELYTHKILLSDVEIMLNLVNGRLVLFRRKNVT
jgi:hypothetical protein